MLTSAGAFGHPADPQKHKDGKHGGQECHRQRHGDQQPPPPPEKKARQGDRPRCRAAQGALPCPRARHVQGSPRWLNIPRPPPAQGLVRSAEGPAVHLFPRGSPNRALAAACRRRCCCCCCRCSTTTTTISSEPPCWAPAARWPGSRSARGRMSRTRAPSGNAAAWRASPTTWMSAASG